MSRTKTKPADWISLIEAAYNLEGSGQQWLDNLCDCADGVLDPSAIRLGFTNRYTPATHRLGLTHFPKIISPLAHIYYSSCDEQSMDSMYRQGRIVGTLSDTPLPGSANAKKVFEIVMKTIYGRSPDFLGVNCATRTGESVTFMALLKERRKPTALERKRWPQVAAHLGAGLRLRNKLRSLSPDTLPVEAVLDSQGKMHHGQGPATGRDSRENLREAVRRIEQARTKAGRSEPDDALDNWEGLVDGRWSLVDRFDSDGKRYVIAVINDPDHPDPRGLTPQERQVAELVGLARSTKQISYSLGVSNSAVTTIPPPAFRKSSVCPQGLNSLASFLRPVCAASSRKLPWPASVFWPAPIRSSTSDGSKFSPKQSAR